MLRRLHTPELRAGRVELDRDEAHHARDVLRLRAGDEVELFDDAGNVARGAIETCDAQAVVALVSEVRAGAASDRITVACAVPKGDRAEWLVEKLGELGVDRFVPLATAHGVVLPAGKNKYERWRRIATEAAKQSRRAGVMTIDELTPLAAALPEAGRADSAACYLSTAPGATSIVDHLQSQRPGDRSPITLFIGPEGGWTDDESAAMDARGLTGVRLTATILRVETAAVAAAAIVATWRSSEKPA